MAKFRLGKQNLFLHNLESKKRLGRDNVTKIRINIKGWCAPNNSFCMKRDNKRFSY